jgi:hypothetical protein
VPGANETGEPQVWALRGIHRGVKADDQVRLVEPQPDLPVGAVGVVLGFCRTPKGEGVAVRFGADGPVAARVVPADGLELVVPRRPPDQ